MRVLYIAYQQLRRYGQTRVSWAQKLMHGLVKNDHFVQAFSDRDGLLTKLREFHNADAKRRVRAALTHDFFHAEMNNTLYAQYVLEASLQVTFSHDYVCARDIHQDGSIK